jgi:para-aminobenzoate synthetase component 1
MLKSTIINPLDKFLKLNEISQPPFAVFFKSPSIFTFGITGAVFEKEGELLVRNLKGTSKRFLDPIEDEESKRRLCIRPERAFENIMITDLVRNDLSHTAQKRIGTGYRTMWYLFFYKSTK